MLKNEDGTKNGRYAGKLVRMRLSVAQKVDVENIMAQPVSCTPNMQFRRPTVMAQILRQDVVTMPGENLTREDEQALFLQFNYARFRIGQIRRKLLRLAKWSKDDVTELLQWNQSQLDARSKIASSNMGLVLAMAKRANYYGVELTDLISEGSVALLRAADKFDCSLGFKFSTYACKAIYKSFGRAAKKHYRYRNFFSVQLGPTVEKDDHLDRAREERHQEQVGEVRTIMRDNLANLSTIELSVVSDRFSLNESESKAPTLKQLGEKLGLSKERVRQIQNVAIGKLRQVAEQRMVAV